ncbi:hypothetical protein G6F50_015570 [Rhizopus delemar]|uniref:Uncharacterized protein n=1 Tax=Rhizopus delemar TaxID=936053 RepID=A0A9P6XXJ8_9FUNG|nr:hypothetical protein G6F50_015570 [Rhizopus delemar]
MPEPRGRLAAPSTAAAAAALAAEQGKGGGKQQRGHAQPQRAVGQQVASQFRNAAVAFSGGPVADGAAQRAHAQRLAQHRDPRIVDVSQQGGAGAEQHQPRQLIGPMRSGSTQGMNGASHRPNAITT